MAICKMCHRTVPAGVDFCEECDSKRKAMSEEDYLTSLLNAFNAPKEPKVREDKTPKTQVNTTDMTAQETFSAPELVVVEKNSIPSTENEPHWKFEFPVSSNTGNTDINSIFENSISASLTDTKAETEEENVGPDFSSLFEDNTVSESDSVSEEIVNSEDIIIPETTEIIEDFNTPEKTDISDVFGASETTDFDIPVTEETIVSDELQMPEELPVSEELASFEEFSALEETPLSEDLFASEEAPASEELSTVEEFTVPEESVISEGLIDFDDVTISEVFSDIDAVSDIDNVSVGEDSIPEDIIQSGIIDSEISAEQPEELSIDIPSEIPEDTFGEIPENIQEETVSEMIPSEPNIPSDVIQEEPASDDISSLIESLTSGDDSFETTEEISEDSSENILDSLYDNITNESVEITESADISDSTESTDFIDNSLPEFIPSSDEITISEDFSTEEEDEPIPEIDDMLSDLLADMDAAGVPEVPAEPIDPDDLSAIFAEAEAAENIAVEESPENDLFEPEPAPAAPSDSGAGMSQADIDALLGNVSEPEPEPAPAPASTSDSGAGMSQADIDALLGNVSEPEPEPAPASTSDSGAGMSQADIDALLGNISEPEPELSETSDLGLIDVLSDDSSEIEPIDLSDLISDADISSDASVIPTSTDDLQIIPEEPIGDVTELSQSDLDAMFIDISGDQSPATNESSETENTTEYMTEQDLENLVNSESGEVDLDKIMDEITSGDFEKKMEDISDNPEKPVKKKSLFTRLFGNIVEELTPEQIEERKRKAIEDEEKKKQAALDKEAKKKLSKEEAAEKKKQAKAEAEEAKKAKAEAAKKKKEEAKEKARKKKEAKAALEELEVDEGRINRVGATILFVLFAIITVFIIVGTNIYSYNLSIKNAQQDFDRKRYNEAYYEVYGLEIKDADIELYDRIMTVMYVNTQLNSYNNYMKVGDSEKAVDSLIKGLQRYDKYLQLATMLNIKEDLNYVKSNILVELEEKFNIDAEQAAIMVAMDDQIDYTENIYNLLGTYEGSGIE